MAKGLLTTILAGAGAGVGGYYVGASMDKSSAPSSALMSKSVLIPGILGIGGWFVLRRKKASVARGLLWGGIAGALYGYMQQSNLASTAATGGTGQAAGAYLGGPTPRAVKRILNSPAGSGLGASILPKRIQSSSSAFPANAWARNQ